MDYTKKTPEEMKEDMVRTLQDLRRSLNYNVALNDLVEQRYEPEEAKAIFIHLALSSLGEKEQIIFLGALQLLPQYQGIKRLNDRRKKVKEEIQYVGKPESLDGSENIAFASIVKAYFNDFIDPAKWESVAQTALKEHYKNGKAVLPTLPSPASAEPSPDATETEKEKPAPEDDADDFGPSPEIFFADRGKEPPEDENKDSIEDVDTVAFEHRFSDYKKRKREHAVRNTMLTALSLLRMLLRILLVLAISCILFVVVPTVFRSEKFANTIVLQERFEGDQTWNDELYGAEVGDIIELQFSFTNNWNWAQRHFLGLMDKLGGSGPAEIMVQFILPDNVEYIEGSTVLYNDFHPDGLQISENGIAASGINIGEYYVKDGSYAWVIRICRSNAKL